MQLRLIIFSVFFVLGTVFKVSGQERNQKDLKHEKKHKLSNNLIKKGSYYSAIEHLEDNARRHPKNDQYLICLADAYFLSRDYKNAELWYDKAVRMQKKVSLALYKYAECLKYNGKYVEARDVFKNFAQSKYRDIKGEKYKQFAKNEVFSCEWAIANSGTNEDTEVAHLGDHVNSRYSEFAPVVMNDSILIFSSLQSDSVITIEAEEAHSFHVKLLFSTKENNEWGPPSELPNVNTRYANNANGTFSLDGKRFYFTRCIPDDDNKMMCSIYMSEVKDGIIQKAVKLNDKINKNGFTSSQPNIGSVVATNNRSYEVLFFSSDRPGGRGGMDIWYSMISSNGEYKTAGNIGNIVNTMRDEITPYFHNQTHALYFSSNYHFGFGGFDVFAAKGTFNQWQKPVNIGKPINTRVDDTYYTSDTFNRAGFLVSNRPEGYHLTSETCCDDIYRYTVKNPFALKVQAYSVKDTSLPVEVKFIVLVKSSDTTSFPASGNYNSKETKQSLAYANFIRSMKDTLAVNTLMNTSMYPEIGSSVHNFDLKKSHDYVIYAIGKFDTSVFIFRSSDLKHDVIDFYSTDSLTENRLIEGRSIDLYWLRFYLDADSIQPVIALKPVIKVVEDETTLTVTKFITEVRENKMGLFMMNYDFGDVNFIEDHASSLDSLVYLLKEFPKLRISISAHTDDKGSDEYNMELSKKRALSMEAFLSGKGISKKRIDCLWFGESQPLVPNSNSDGSDNPANRHFNRRTEISVVE